MIRSFLYNGRCLDNHTDVDSAAVDTTAPVVPVVRTDVGEFHYPGQWPVPYHEMPSAVVIIYTSIEFF